MNNVFANLLFFLLLCSCTYAQEPYHTYTLLGTINSDSGVIMLRPITRDSVYYPFKSHIEANVVNGKFMFTDSINYPTAYRFALQKNSETVYASGIFLIEPGLQKIACNVDSLREIPNISNNSMDEYKKNFTGDFFNENYSSLLRYTEENPNSYISLWWLISKLYTYDPVSFLIYTKFSDSLKDTPTGQNLVRKLQKLKASAIGNVFPQLGLLDSNYSRIIIPKKNKKYKYILIDFWYSHCNPCIIQLPKFKKLYDDYKQSGFVIIGISIDQVQYLKDWKNIIITKKLDWPQYWDKDAINATELLSIEGYPSNFLLDQNGIIIKKNIKPEELEKILAK